MSQLDFCPKCLTLLSTNMEENKISYQCPNCKYNQSITGKHVLSSNKFNTSKHIRQLPYGLIYDNAVKRTARIKCRNVECPSHNKEEWGKVQDNGVLIQPDIAMVNYNDPNRVSTYICRVCESTFRA